MQTLQYVVSYDRQPVTAYVEVTNTLGTVSQPARCTSQAVTDAQEALHAAIATELGVQRAPIPGATA